MNNTTHERFYFWEDMPGFGVRCMGQLAGYPCLEDLMASPGMEWHIEKNKKEDIPCWITKSTVFKVILEGPKS